MKRPGNAARPTMRDVARSPEEERGRQWFLFGLANLGFFSGTAAMGLGLLLSTVWADVDVRRGEGGVEVAMSIRSR